MFDLHKLEIPKYITRYCEYYKKTVTFDMKTSGDVYANINNLSKKFSMLKLFQTLDFADLMIIISVIRCYI